jgi:hypothetical protein
MTDHFPLVVPGSETASPAREGRRVMCCAPSLRLLFASGAIEATNELREAHRSLSVLALHEGVPRAMDHHSSGCLPVGKFSTFASGRQDRGQVNPSNCRRPFHLARLRDVAQEESPAYEDGSATSSFRMTGPVMPPGGLSGPIIFARAE